MANTQEIHVCFGFYLNGDYVVNHVRDEDLKGNIEYNRRNRPGRFYFVDGEYVCGGALLPEPQAEFIAKCLKRIEDMNIKPSMRDSRPYL